MVGKSQSSIRKATPGVRAAAAAKIEARPNGPEAVDFSFFIFHRDSQYSALADKWCDTKKIEET